MSSALDLVIVWLTGISEVAKTLENFQRDPGNIHAALDVSSDAKVMCSALRETHRVMASKANFSRLVYAASVEGQAFDRLLEWEQWKQLADLGV